MEYSIFKESKPKETVEKIKNILDKIGFPVEEEVFKHREEKVGVPYSLRVRFPDCNEFGTNGKGVSLINAKASAYAEFMERLQNAMLIPFEPKGFTVAPDEEIVNFASLNRKKFCNLTQDDNLLLLLNKLANNHYKKSLSEEETLLIPFYSLKENRKVSLPVLIYGLLQGTNGMAAGNTIEEALVQGLSEICERFALKKVIEDKISIPDIPSFVYLKYKKIKDMIHTFNENGYQISIKDASLGLGLPVVCVLVQDTNFDNVSLSFGSHPSLPVAIERCLTEYAQGIDITVKNKPTSNVLFLSKDSLQHLSSSNNLRFLFEKQFIHHVYIENCDYIQNQFFKSKSQLEFDSSSWINNEDNHDNKSLLKFILKKIMNYTSEIYVRDVSYLGFPTVYIVIPKMSFTMVFDLERTKETLSLSNWLIEDNQNEYQSIVNLFNSLVIRKTPKFFLNAQVSDVPNEYILLLCSIYLKDYRNMKKLSKLIIQNNKVTHFFKEELISKISVFQEFSSLKLKGVDDTKIFVELKNKFTDEDIKKFKVFIKYLSSEIIKKIIKPYNSKLDKKLQYNMHKEKFAEIVSVLSNKYRENLPNQSELKNTFEGI